MSEFLAPPQRWEQAARLGWMAEEALAAWRAARQPETDAWLAKHLCFAVPMGAYCGVGRVMVDPATNQFELFAPCRDGGIPALIVPVLQSWGEVVDLVAIDLHQCAPAMAALGTPAFWQRAGLASALGFGDGDPAKEAFTAREPVLLAADPLDWLRLWAARAPGEAAPPAACVLESALTAETHRLLLEGELVCTTEALAAGVDRYRKEHDKGAKKARGKILIAGDVPATAKENAEEPRSRGEESERDQDCAPEGAQQNSSLRLRASPDSPSDDAARRMGAA